MLSIDEALQEVKAVTIEEVRGVAEELLTNEKLNMAVVGPCRGHKRLERLLRL